MNLNTPFASRLATACPLVPTAVELGEDLLDFVTLFERQVSLTPQRLAIVHEDRELSYQQLADASCAFASDLVAAGVLPGQCVGLCLDRSPEAIAAMLGVLRIGGIFVPLDPEYPLDRLAYMVADADIKAIIAEPTHRRMLKSGLNERVKGSQNIIHWLDGTPRDANQCGELPEVCIAPSDVAYIMYTSGSTGKPKGVQIEHAGLAAYCFADIDVYRVVPEDRTLQFSTLNFDIAIEEIFPPLLTGGCVVVRPSQRSEDRNELSAIVRQHHITAIHLATAYWHQWVDLMVATDERVPSSIRLMIVTGEKVSVEHYRRWQSICDHDVLWCNAYGPTEATVSATVFIPNEDFDAASMPIGKPLKRYEAVILDESLCEVATGETGQLYIGGPALARGYLNRPDLTQQAFVEFPRQDGVPQRFYRTGDLARWLPDGNIDFGGRIDHQIKLGSYRIEPGEIEAALDQHPGVLESLVSYDELDGKKYLIAYAATGNALPGPAELAGFLRARLPGYMVPARYALMSEFPKTINGKIDRQRLDPNSSLVARDENYVAPRNEMEHRLAELWQDVLHVPEVGIHDDFFLLGGSSLLVTQVVARLTAELQLELPVRDFFANPTVATAAKHLLHLTGTAASAVGDEEDQWERRRRLPKIDAAYFPSGKEQLFSVHYRPTRPAHGHAVLLCHAYGHEYARSFRNLQQLAVQLAQHGFDVLRFDYASTGNSTGDCSRAIPQRWEHDISAAANHLLVQSQAKQFSAIGVRLGATALANTKLANLDHLILWDPVIDGSQFIAELERFHDYALRSLTRFNRKRDRGPIDQLFGHRMEAAKRQSFCQANLTDVVGISAKQCLVVTSHGYLSTQPGGSQIAADWNCRETADEIRWHDAAYTESAFSSPEIFRVVLETLSRSEN